MNASASLRLLLFAAATAIAFGTPPNALAQQHAAGVEREVSAPGSASELLAAFSQMPGLEARFTEEKHIGMLAAPLESSGVLYFDDEGYMLRRVLEPQPMDVLVTPSTLRLTEAGQSEEIDFSTRPDVARFVTAFMWLLAGDETALEAAYQIEFQLGAAEGEWVMTLTPRDEQVRYIIREIAIRGDGFYVRELRVLEGSGDETITRITDADPQRRYSEQEARELFGTP